MKGLSWPVSKKQKRRDAEESIAASQAVNDLSHWCVIVADEHGRPLFDVPLEGAINGEAT
jgi:hypothetical protein